MTMWANYTTTLHSSSGSKLAPCQTDYVIHLIFLSFCAMHDVLNELPCRFADQVVQMFPYMKHLPKVMSFVTDVLCPWIPARPKSPCARNGKIASVADQIFRSSEQSEHFPTILFLCSLGICRQSSSGLGLFLKEAVCVDAAIRHQGEMFIWSMEITENDMAYDLKYLDCMLQLYGGNLQPSWRGSTKMRSTIGRFIRSKRRQSLGQFSIAIVI